MPVYEPPKLREMYNVTLNNFSTLTPLTIPTAGYVGASDGVGGIRFVAQSGGSGGSNAAFSNLRVADTLSTSSTFTDFISSAQIITSSIVAQSALIVGSNTLTVFGQTFLSSLTLTGQLLISTIPGQPAPPLNAELISSLNVITSTLTYNDDIKIQSLTNTTSRIALGYRAGEATQGAHSIAIGESTAIADQGQYAIAIGYGTGFFAQEQSAIAIGTQAGVRYQRNLALAVGDHAGFSNQGQRAIALGYNAGQSNQGSDSISLGSYAGGSNQGQYAIALGSNAGTIDQGQNAIAIGSLAGYELQSTNTIVLNATGSALNTISSNSFYVAPIRYDPTATLSTLFYNDITREITYGPGTGGGAISSNLGLSNLSLVDTLSTASTFTDFISAGQLYASSIVVQSAVIVGSNTLTVYGQTFMSSVTLTGQFLISTIPGQPAAPLSSELVSSLNVQTSTVNFVDTTNAGVIKSLYVEAGSLKYDGFTLGTTTIDSNFGFSNLNIIDTLSTTSTFSVEISTGQLKVSTILFDDANTEYNLYSQGGQLYYNNAPVGGGGSVSSNLGLSNLSLIDTLSTVSTFTSTLVANLTLTNSLINAPGGLVSYSNSSVNTEGTKVTVDPYTGYFYASGRGNNSVSTILYSSDGSNWSTINSGGFASNTFYTGFNYNVYNATAIFGFSTTTDEAQSYIFAGGLDSNATKQVIQVSQSNASIEPVDFISLGTPPKLQTVRCFSQSNTPLNSRVYIGGTPATGGYPLYYSDDMASSWTPISTTQFSIVFGLATDMTATPSLTVAVGKSFDGAQPTSTIQVTYDGGDTWTSATWTTTGFDSRGTDVIVDGTTFYACGDSTNDTNRVLKSTDGGLTWSTGGSVPVDSANAIATNGSRLVITGAAGSAGSYSSIGISEDGGTNWYSATTGGFKEGTDSGQSIAYANGTWVAVGYTANNPTSTIIYSTDGGSNWTSANVGQFSGSNYNVGLNVDSGYGTLRSDNIVANSVDLNTLYVQQIDAQDDTFRFIWGKSPINAITEGKVSTTAIEVSSINGVQFPRMYFSTLETDPSDGTAQWDFPKPFSSANSYAATLTANVNPAGAPINVSISEVAPSYVQFSTFNLDGTPSPGRIVYGTVIGV